MDYELPEKGRTASMDDGDFYKSFLCSFSSVGTSDMMLSSTSSLFDMSLMAEEDEVLHDGGGDSREPPKSTLPSIVQHLRNKRWANSIAPNQNEAHVIPSVDDKLPVLHQACMKPNVCVQEIDKYLRMDPKSCSKPVMASSGYQFPLNLALKNQQSPAVISMLIEAAPSVLVQADGPSSTTSLHILLKYNPGNIMAADQMLLLRPDIAFVADAHGNTPLHLAILMDAPPTTLKHLAIMAPETLQQCNGIGRTPMALARQSCSPDLQAFLWQQQAKSLH